MQLLKERLALFSRFNFYGSMQATAETASLCTVDDPLTALTLVLFVYPQDPMGRAVLAGGASPPQTPSPPRAGDGAGEVSGRFASVEF
jgi:hypothetical protein